MALSPQARMVDALLEADGRSLQTLLIERRASGTSYRRIAQELYRLTEGVVDVTGETIRNWLEDLAEVAS